jgi:hypothetical protein
VSLRPRLAGGDDVGVADLASRALPLHARLTVAEDDAREDVRTWAADVVDMPRELLPETGRPIATAVAPKVDPETSGHERTIVGMSSVPCSRS